MNTYIIEQLTLGTERLDWIATDAATKRPLPFFFKTKEDAEQHVRFLALSDLSEGIDA